MLRESVRLIIADDHELVRRGLVRILASSHPEWEIVAEAATGAAAIEAGLSLSPHAAILDLAMPDLNGIEVAERLIAALPDIKILILTMHASMPIMQHLQKAGVKAYLAKNEAPRKLVAAMERMLADEPFFASAAAYRRPDELEAPEYVPSQFLLMKRELEVMRLLSADRSNKEVAGDLGMSVRTVEQHHASILAKLGVNSLGDLVKIAIRDRLI
jgi:DNA-binding NarL/FixJ family response regulator